MYEADDEMDVVILGRNSLTWVVRLCFGPLVVRDEASSPRKLYVERWDGGDGVTPSESDGQLVKVAGQEQAQVFVCGLRYNPWDFWGHHRSQLLSGLS